VLGAVAPPWLQHLPAVQTATAHATEARCPWPDARPPGRAQIDQAALTGESLPAKKFSGDVAFSGSAIKQGERHAVVYATGANTFFGRAAGLIGSTHNVANIQKVPHRPPQATGTLQLLAICAETHKFRGAEAHCCHPTNSKLSVKNVSEVPCCACVCSSGARCCSVVFRLLASQTLAVYFSIAAHEKHACG